MTSVRSVTTRKRLLAGSLGVVTVASLALGYWLSGPGEATHRVDDDVTIGSQEDPGSANGSRPERDARLGSADVQTLAGSTVNTDELLGSPMVINVWYSTCTPCAKELPAFAAVHRELGDQVRFVGIDAFAPSQREEDFARELGVQYELLYDASGEFAVANGIVTAPVTLFVAADGTIVRQTGQLDAERLREIIVEELLVPSSE